MTEGEQGSAGFIDEARIASLLEAGASGDRSHVREILDRALALKGLSLEEVAVLVSAREPELQQEIFEAARRVKQAIYGARLVLFAPLYISNRCANDCLYCAFRARNTALPRRSLSQEEIAEEVRILVEQGHKRLLLVAGESYPSEGFSYVLRAIETLYKVRSGNGEVRRVNVNVAPLTLQQFRELQASGIGTYQLFQETYHRQTYARVHVAGRKRDYDWRATAMDRAMEAGINDVGVGALFGLHDWRFELLALMQHAQHLEQRFGVGPHTISVPRMEPAVGSEMAIRPPHPVSDDDFLRLVAILRLAVPYTGIILSTRESPELRRAALGLGVSQISAGSRTNPGGYSDNAHEVDASQFELGDHRSLDEVVHEVASMGYLPSFCTGCYRMGRTGKDFMDLARPGAIRFHCDPNGLSTFSEYLLDYASPRTREVGEKLIDQVIEGMDPRRQAVSRRLVEAVRGGKRDVYV